MSIHKTERRLDILTEINRERESQYLKYGPPGENHKYSYDDDGDESQWMEQSVAMAQDQLKMESEYKDGVTWDSILNLKFQQAVYGYAKGNTPELRKRLLQLASVDVAAIEQLDSTKEVQRNVA